MPRNQIGIKLVKYGVWVRGVAVCPKSRDEF
jgi:hypothetical protein